MADAEKKPPADKNYYRDTYWNDLPAAQAHLNSIVSGSRDMDWMQYVKARYAPRPFKKGLAIGCGDGHIERQMLDAGIAAAFDAFDCSEHSVEHAIRERGGRPITYQVATFDEFQPEGSYDLIVNVAALHHVDNLEQLLKKLHAALLPEGIFVNYDYIGPNRNQYTDEHLRLMEEANRRLPERFRSKHPLRLPVGDFIRGDITEAIHAFEILPAFREFFEIIEYRELGGGLAYQILWNNIDEFLKGGREADAALSDLLRRDEQLTRRRVIPSLHAFFVGRAKGPTDALRLEVDDFYQQRLREYTMARDAVKGEPRKKTAGPWARVKNFFFHQGNP